MSPALIILAFFTSLTTAVFGLGGGMLLIAGMPGFLPAPAVIPVHAVVQLASNASRGLLAFRAICWRYTAAFLAGSVLGGGLAAQIVGRMDLSYAPLAIAALILFNVWGPPLAVGGGRRGEFAFVGALQTALGMLGGATGPLGAANLYRHGLSREPQVATNAVFMSTTHVVKIVMFAAIGFTFAPYLPLIAAMIIASVAGSLVGTRIRQYVPELRFRRLLRWLLTLLALRIVFVVFAGP